MIHQQASKTHLLVSPRAMTNSATNTANLDCVGADYATIRVAFKSEINTNAVGPTLVISESDDTVVTNFSTLSTRSAEDITNGKVVVYHIDTRAKKRYLRLAVTTATTTNDDVTMSAVAETGRRADKPVNTTDMVATTNDAVVIL